LNEENENKLLILDVIGFLTIMSFTVLSLSSLLSGFKFKFILVWLLGFSSCLTWAIRYQTIDKELTKVKEELYD